MPHDEGVSAVGGTAERFASLQGDRLERAWRADLPGSGVPHVVVALPSYSLDRSVLEHHGARVAPLENRFLYVLLRAADPFTRVVYLSSRPVDPQIVEGHLSMAAPSERRQILDRVLLVSPDDVSPRALAEKVLAQPMLLNEVRRFIGDDVGLIEPWNVTEAERDFAVALDLPMYDTDPSLWELATKSGGGRLFRELGVPHPAGFDGVTSSDDVAAAIRRLRRADPALAGVVVKLDDSPDGDGNVVLTRQMLDAGGSSLDELVRRSLPAWYVDILRHGGVVEELVAGDEFCSPSGQGEVRPDGTVAVLATHDQRLGGANGQVFEGCTFPAQDEYAGVIAEQVSTIGQALVDHGAVGRFAIDFAAVRRQGTWDVRAPRAGGHGATPKAGPPACPRPGSPATGSAVAGSRQSRPGPGDPAR
jgi:hypothetical protein